MLTKTANLLRSIFKAFAYMILVLGIVAGALYLALPDTDFLVDHDPQISSYMIEALKNSESKQNHIDFTPLSHISPSVIRAVLVAEDDLFFSHEGFNWKALQSAFKTDLKKGHFSKGASTISQQLARNLFLTKEKSILRKLREAIITIRLEDSLSKARILELYLNVAEFGPGIYGIAAASEYHFNKTPANLTAAEGSLLAGVLPNPKRYGTKPYPRYTFTRQRQILYRMSRYDLHLPSDLFKKPAAQVKLADSVPVPTPVSSTTNNQPDSVPPVVTNELPEAAFDTVPPPDTQPLPPAANGDEDSANIHIDEF